MNALKKSVPELAVALAILGLVTAAAWFQDFSAVEAIGVIGILVGVVGVLTLAVLNSAQPNSDLWPHLIFTLAVLAAAAVLLFHHVFSSAEFTAIITPILGGSAGVAASVSNSNAIASIDPGSAAGVGTANPKSPAPPAGTATIAIVPSFEGAVEMIETQAAKWGESAADAFSKAVDAKAQAIVADAQTHTAS